MAFHVKPIRRYHFSPLRYPGGKTSLYPLICDLLKENKNGSVTYIEPYAGGAGVALALLLTRQLNKLHRQGNFSIIPPWKKQTRVPCHLEPKSNYESNRSG